MWRSNYLYQEFLFLPMSILDLWLLNLKLNTSNLLNLFLLVFVWFPSPCPQPFWKYPVLYLKIQWYDSYHKPFHVMFSLDLCLKQWWQEVVYGMQCIRSKNIQSNKFITYTHIQFYAYISLSYSKREVIKWNHLCIMNCDISRSQDIVLKVCLISPHFY